MKTIRKAGALLCVLMLLVSAFPLMPVAAATGIDIDFRVDKANPAPGEYVTMSVYVDGLNADDCWNLLEFEIGYDDEKMVPVKQRSADGSEVEYVAGPAMKEALATVAFTNYDGKMLNPIKAAIISTEGQVTNGEIMRIRFRVKTTVTDGEKVTLTPQLKALAKSEIDGDQLSSSVPLVPPKTETVTMTTVEPPVPVYCPLSFALDKRTVEAGDYVTMTMTLDELPGLSWYLLDFEVAYDATKLAPVMQADGQGVAYTAGAALPADTDYVHLAHTNGNIIGEIRHSDAMTALGDVLSIRFLVKEETRAGDVLTVTPKVNRMARRVMQNGVTTDIELSAEEETLLTATVKKPVDPSAESPISFSMSKTTVSAGDYVLLSVSLDELADDHYWNLLDFGVAYDADKIIPVKQVDEYGDEYEYMTGPALRSGTAIISVSFKNYQNEWLNPLLVGIISNNNQTRIGELIHIMFRVKDTVKSGDTIEINPILNAFSRSVIEDGTSTVVDMAPAGSVDLFMSVKEVTGIAVESKPAKETYTAGEALDLTGGKLTVTYDDNTTEVVDMTADMVTGFDTNTVGTQALTVSYKGQTTTFDVTVNPAYVLGDMDGDKNVAVADALLALQIATGKVAPDPQQLLAGSVDKTEGMQVGDSLMILQFATQKIRTFPIEQ